MVETGEILCDAKIEAGHYFLRAGGLIVEKESCED